MPKNANSEGSIYKDKNGRWRGAVTLYCENGTPKRKYLSGRTKREVTEKVNKLLNEVKYNDYTEPSKITFYEWLMIWIDMYCIGQLKPSTTVNYEAYIDRHIKSSIGNIKLCDLTPLMLQRFYQEKYKNGRLDGTGGLSAKTMHNLHTMIHTALDKAYKMGYVNRNVSDLVTVPKIVKQERRFFTVEEQTELQKYLPDERIGMAVLLDLYTGLRMGELLGLPWENVHLDLNGDSYIKITQTINRIKNPDRNSPQKTILFFDTPKTKYSIRTIPLLPEIAEKLSQHREKQLHLISENGWKDTGLVFLTSTGTPFDPKNFQNAFKAMLKRHNMRIINVHGIRHTFATRSLESGMDIKTLSRILGHSSIQISLDLYAHVTDQLQAEHMENLRTFLK
ncbi:MAG: site-specific integrase [Ruminococcus sp.]|nr:site-specific integrase [Ruminococcus sp.]